MIATTPVAGRRSRIDVQSLVPVATLVVMVVVLSALNPAFLSVGTALNLMAQVSVVGIVALGATMVLITAGIDFTTGYGLAAIGMAVGSVFLQTNGNVVAMIATGIIGGAILGMANGVLIAKLQILPFIATLAMMLVAQGLSTFIEDGRMIMLSGSPLLWIGQGRIAGSIPASFAIYVVLCLLAAAILNLTRFGTSVYAVGGNEPAARYSGIHVDRIKLYCYTLAGVFTGVAALITIAKIGMATPGISGSTLLDAIAASVIGGASLSGGRGKVSGTFVGVIIIVLIGTALTYLNIPPEMQDVFKGIVILIAVCFDQLVRRYARRYSSHPVE
ncbi:MAG: ABC transporter permease [Actinobacteria bacterium]|nr:ABC transporter permease [Actinomycetota bacterium]